MDPQKKQWSLLAQNVIQKLKRRNMEGYYCETAEEAVELALGIVNPGETVAWGGSVTLQQTGMLDALKQREDIQVLDRDVVRSAEEKYELHLRSFGADAYFMSSNAITRDGILVNIDGAGNRAACLIYGPRKIVMLVGMNKVVADAEAGISRIRNVAAPPNCLRLKLETPCAQTGYCMNCQSKSCICGDIVITRHCKEEGRIKVILIGESLGY